MSPVYRYVSPPSKCAYLPHETWQLEYELIPLLTKELYLERINQGWRRTGHILFRPHCPRCTSCKQLRVLVDKFTPNRSQRRLIKHNEGSVRLEIGAPDLTEELIDIYLRHHYHHKETRGWPQTDIDQAIEHLLGFMEGPIKVQSWRFFIGEKLVAVSFIDELADGFSGIYFVHDPDYREYSLGNWICLSLIQEAAQRKMPYVYLGYVVEGCTSMEYKGKFEPNQILMPDGSWQDFRGEKQPESAQY